MRWSYKTVHYDLKKEGLLGSAFLDESEVEQSLNEFGKAGWELVSILETQEGLIAIFKQPLSLGREAFSAEEKDERRYEPLRRDNAPPVHSPPGKQQAKDLGRVAVPAVAIEEYEIIVDEPRLAKKKSPPDGDGDIGSIRIE